MPHTEKTMDRYADQWLSGKPIYITAMDQCSPQTALSGEASHQRWRVMSYRGEHLSGQLLVAGAETEAPPIKLPLTKRG